MTISGDAGLFPLTKELIVDKYNQSMIFARDSIVDTRDTLDRLSDAVEVLRGIDVLVSIDKVSPVQLPEVFTLIPPSIPTGISMTLPSSPAKPGLIRIDISDLNLPDMEYLPVPSVAINAGPQSYSSQLLSAVQVKLLRDINEGGTGIPIEVREDIYNYEYEKNLQELLDTKDKIANEWSKRGLPIPDSALISALAQADVAYLNRGHTVSRDIRIEHMKLAHQNTQFAVQQSVALEQVLVGFASMACQRIFEASKAQVEMQIAVVNSLLQKYRIMTDIYTAIVSSRIELARATVQIYSAEVEAYKSEIMAESMKVDAQLKTFLAEVDIFKAKASVFESLSNVNIKIFEAYIQEAISKASLYLKEAEIRIQSHAALNGMKMETLRSIAATTAQFVAGALSSVSAGATIGIDGKVSSSVSEQFGESHEYKYEGDRDPVWNG